MTTTKFYSKQNNDIFEQPRAQSFPSGWIQFYIILCYLIIIINNTLVKHGLRCQNSRSYIATPTGDGELLHKQYQHTLLSVCRWRTQPRTHSHWPLGGALSPQLTATDPWDVGFSLGDVCPPQACWLHYFMRKGPLESVLLQGFSEFETLLGHKGDLT